MAKVTTDMMVIRKDNWLVRETTNEFSKEQNKLMCVLLGKYVNLQDDTCIDTTITVAELIDTLDLSDGAKNYRKIRKAISDFGKRGSVGFVHLNKNGVPEYVWMPYFNEIKCDGTDVTFSWNDKMKEHLIKLKENYTQFLASNYLKLNSVYSQNLYEYLKSVQNFEDEYHKRPSVSYEEMRQIMKVGDKYKDHTQFKTRCIARAVDEINKATDLMVEIITVKTGRKVTGFEFSILAKGGKKGDYHGCILNYNEAHEIVMVHYRKRYIYALAELKKKNPYQYQSLRKRRDHRPGYRSDYDIIMDWIQKERVG